MRDDDAALAAAPRTLEARRASGGGAAPIDGVIAASGAASGGAAGGALDALDDAVDEGDVDLSFAGPVPVEAAPWPARLLDLVSAYLPLLLMALLAAATWWLVDHSGVTALPTVEAPPKHEPDYEMTGFTIQRFAAGGALQSQIQGRQLRHYPDDDTLEVDDARIRSYAADGVVTTATARRALANGDGSEIQLLGDARVSRPAQGSEPAVEFRSEFLHAFRNLEQVRSHLPVIVTRGSSIVRAGGMQYDHLNQVIDLQGHTSASFEAKGK